MNNETSCLSLISSANHAADSLGLYRAELARILGLMCRQVTDLTEFKTVLKSSPEHRYRAQRFVSFYTSLENRFSADSVAMMNWFRRQNKELGTTPLLALVDENRLEETIKLISV